MGFLKKNNRLGWVVLMLIVMNIVSLSVLWIGHTQRPDRKGGDGPGGKFLEERLELTTAQTDQLREIRKEHFEAMMILTDDLKEKRMRLHGLPRSGSNSSQLDELASAVGAAQAKIEKEIYQHFSQIRAVCTDEQKRKLDEIMIDVLERGDRRGGPGGPPPHRPSGPGGERPGPGH